MTNLNSEQLRIKYEDPKKNICIIACAGSGKTTTIIHRIEYLIKSIGINPSEIILTTFTHNASEDMISRLSNVAKNITVGTIDSIALHTLQKYNLLNDQIYHIREYIYLLNKFLKTEESKLFTNKIKYLFVDEFQDINDDQFEFIYALYLRGVIITTVGDDYQNIYTFRDSNIKYILNFEKYFKNSSKFILNKNYRSTEQIINISNDILSGEKKMYSGKLLQGLKPVIVNIVDWAKQYDYMLKIINERSIPLHKIAILSRNSGLLYNIEAFFLLQGIPNILIESFDEVRSSITHNHLTITTIHKSKGLEWDIVFLLGLHDLYFPSADDNIDEEKRLFYVAITRAKLELYLMVDKYATRFVKDISEENVTFEGISASAVQNSKIPLKTKQHEEKETLDNCPFEELLKIKNSLNNVNIKQKKIYDEFSIPKEVIENNLYHEFSNFILLAIKKMFCKKLLFSETILKIIFSIKVDYKIYEKQKKNQENKINTKTLLDRFQKKPSSLNSTELKIISKAHALETTPDKIFIEPEKKYEYFDIYLPILTDSFMKYTNPETTWSNILKDIYHVSLLKKLSNKRIKGLFFPLDVEKLIDFLQIIYKNINIKIATSSNVFEPSFKDESDVVWLIKFSNLKMEWLLELKELKCSKAYILNPITGILYSIVLDSTSE